MGVAEAYADFFDPGLVSEITPRLPFFSIDPFIGIRVNFLRASLPPLVFRSNVEPGKNNWWKGAVKLLEPSYRWYLRVGEFEGDSWDEILLEAAESGPDAWKLGDRLDWATQTMLELTGQIRELVTGTRLLAAGVSSDGVKIPWSRQDRSFGNRAANAMIKELSIYDKLILLERSRKKLTER